MDKALNDRQKEEKRPADWAIRYLRWRRMIRTQQNSLPVGPWDTNRKMAAGTMLIARLSMLLQWRRVQRIQTVMMAITVTCQIWWYNLRTLWNWHAEAQTTGCFLMFKGLEVQWRCPLPILRGVHCSDVLQDVKWTQSTACRPNPPSWCRVMAKKLPGIWFLSAYGVFLIERMCEA